MRILVVEDERHLNEVLVKRLRKQGYTVDSCEDGRSARDFIAMTSYDAVVLDIELPLLSGMDVLREARAQGNRVPIIMLTARDSIADRVAGLDAGANDYLVKPFAFEELLARLRVLVREKTGNQTNELSLDDLVMNVDAHTASRAGESLTLSAKEFSMLEYLLAHKGQVLSRQQIQDHLWDYDYEGSSNMVDVYIRYLRKKVDEGHQTKLIHTVRGVGYVLRLPDAAPARS